MRWGMMILRLCGPAIFLATAAGIVEVALRQLPRGMFFQAVAFPLRLAPPVLALASAVALCWAAWRYWRGAVGQAPTCPRCGGLQGLERFGRWGVFRKCLACGQNASSSVLPVR